MLTTYLALLMHVPAAPAPLPRPALVKSLVPTDLSGPAPWALDWHEGEAVSRWTMILRPDGTYRCVQAPAKGWDGRPEVYEGWWELRDGALCVQDVALRAGEDFDHVAMTDRDRLRIWRVPFDRLPCGRLNRHALAGTGGYLDSGTVRVRMRR